MLKKVLIFIIIFNNYLCAMDFEDNYEDYNESTAVYTEDENPNADSDIDLDSEVPKIGKLEELKEDYFNELYYLNNMQQDLETSKSDKNLEFKDKANCDTKIKKKYNKIFTCPKCKKEFKRNDGLTAHKIVHSGKNPFKCPSCEKTYTSMSGFYKHKKKYHN